MKIRSAGPLDLSAITALQTESWKDTYSKVLPEHYLSRELAADLTRHWEAVTIEPEDVLLVAEDDGVVGFIAAWFRPEPYIDNLHVKPSMRSRGVGSMLMKAVAKQLIL